MQRSIRLTAIAIFLSASAAHLSAQAAPDTATGYADTTLMIPMRDGTRLHTRVFRPKVQTEALPFVMLRTPYGIAGASRQLRSYLKAMADDGYLFVFQDIRGRYASEGQFLMNRPLHDPGDAKGVDESTDTYDTVEWLLANIPRNSGRVGVLGVSYPGWLAAMAGVNAHPAVKAVSPQAPMTDTWMGDDFFHYGAFRLSYGFEYSSSLELSNDGSAPVPIDRYDTYDWYLSQGPLSNLTRLLAGRVPTWTNFTKHPTYDAFWQARALPTYLTRLTVPTMTVGGWYDQEDFYGALRTYKALEAHDTANINYLVMGPWNHGGWARGAGDSLGRISWDDSTGSYFREQAQEPWFRYWLKMKGRLPLPEALVFEGGSNSWRAFDQWPPKAAKTTNLYFGPQGTLSFTAPTATGASAADSYVSDPARPVPYRQRPIQLTYHPQGSDWYTWLVQDQRQVQGRPDVLTFQTGPLTEPVTIAGDIAGKLFASTTGQDADWVVKLIDVYPDSATGGEPRMGGYQLMVTSEILRGRYHKSFSHPEPLVPGKVTPFTVDLHQQSYQFQRGHRIMVQVQSTWFPVYDRNPQTWVANIFEAPAGAYRAQTHRVLRSATYPSHVELPVLTP